MRHVQINAIFCLFPFICSFNHLRFIMFLPFRIPFDIFLIAQMITNPSTGNCLIILGIIAVQYHCHFIVDSIKPTLSAHNFARKPLQITAQRLAICTTLIYNALIYIMKPAPAGPDLTCNIFDVELVQNGIFFYSEYIIFIVESV